MGIVYYSLSDTSSGILGLVWINKSGMPLIKRICLTEARKKTESIINQAFPRARGGSHHSITEISKAIQQYLSDGRRDFSLQCLDMESCGTFQKKVLLQDWEIPHGMVCSYGGLANRLHMPKAARAVGTAQARNPFPFVIPCHRVIRADGKLGGYGGGPEMKKHLLELEGVEISAAGKVPAKYFWMEH